MSKKIGITEEDRRRMVEFYEAGSTQVELASLFGVSQPSIGYHLRKAGTKTRQGRDAQPFKADPEEARRLYESGLSQDEVAEQLGVAQGQVGKYLKHLGVETRSRNARKYEIDEAFFDVVDPVSAYWAGFIAADGCIVPTDGSRQPQVSIGIHPKDVGLLEAFSRACGLTMPIHTRPNMSGREYVYLRVSSGRWCESLERHYSITPRKAKTLVPPTHIAPAEAWAFARGYFDGDGHARKDGSCLQVTSGSKVFLEWMIRDLFDAPHKIYDANGSWGCYVAGPVFRRVVVQLYEGSTEETRLRRKYERFKMAGVI